MSPDNGSRMLMWVWSPSSFWFTRMLYWWDPSVDGSQSVKAQSWHDWILWITTSNQLKKFFPSCLSAMVGLCVVKLTVINCLAFSSRRTWRFGSMHPVSVFAATTSYDKFILLLLDNESTATLIHAFVSSCVDYCCSLLIRSLKTVTDKLQHALNAAASIVMNTWSTINVFAIQRWSPLGWHHWLYRILSCCYNAPLLTRFCSGTSTWIVHTGVH